VDEGEHQSGVLRRHRIRPGRPRQEDAVLGRTPR
jgi:hypothetical protein